MVPSIFAALLSVELVTVHSILLGQEISYSKLYKNVSFFNLRPVSSVGAKHFLNILQGSIQ